MGEIVFLGTGSAWRTPEHGCECSICSTMRERNEERARSSILIQSNCALLIDCGPDLLNQMKTHNMGRPDAVLITHEHGDHFLGMDDLLAFRRTIPANEWKPIPVYASYETWKSVETRFSYLLGSLIEKHIAVPNQPIVDFGDTITPFRTDHGVTAPGSVGYVIECGDSGAGKKIVYTSDFAGLPEEPDFLSNSDILIFQSHWLNEPDENRPSHMSLQRGIDYIRRWAPIDATYLIHISGSDIVSGDPRNNILKKTECSSPLISPRTGVPYPTPRCQSEWQSVVDTIARDFEISCKMLVSYDGLRVSL